VYSFGVVLLEILSGRAPIDTNLPEEEINIARWVRNLITNHAKYKYLTTLTTEYFVVHLLLETNNKYWRDIFTGDTVSTRDR